jgi:hypothetical protein
MNKKKMIAAAVASLGIASVVGVGTVAAQQSSGTSLAEKIATKFNLNKDEVQQVIDEEHQARHAEMQKRAEERLQEAVDDGKLTSDQKDKILAKMKEMAASRETKRGEMKNMSQVERHAAMKAEREVLEQWAKDNNIPTEYLRLGGRGHEPGGMRGDGPPPEATQDN